MAAFDRPLKYLVEQNPEAFAHFILGKPCTVVEPIAKQLKARTRQLDACHRMLSPEGPWIWHLEFHRRKQQQEALAYDVADAQLRLAKREKMPVLSTVLDLYGKTGTALCTPVSLDYGFLGLGAGSKSVYYRINLRAISGEELLMQAHPVLWPLVPLAKDGMRSDVLISAQQALATRPGLSDELRLNCAAILHTVAQAEGVDVRFLSRLYPEEFLMRSTLYARVMRESKKLGREEGREEGRQEGILLGQLQVLQTALGLEGIPAFETPEPLPLEQLTQQVERLSAQLMHRLEGR